MDSFVHYVVLTANLVALFAVNQTKSIELHTDKAAHRLYPDQPKAAAVLQNDDVTFYCSLSNETMSNDVTVPYQSIHSINDVSFGVGNETVKDDAVSFNESTASVTLRNVTLASNGTVITCSSDQGREEDQLILLVGGEPEKNLSFTCEAFDWKTISCTWRERKTMLFTKYSMAYAYPGGSWTSPDICINGYSCRFTKSTLGYMYRIRLRETTALKTSETQLEFLTRDIMKLPVVADLSYYNVTSRDCNVTWKKRTSVVSYGFVYEIFVTPGLTNSPWRNYNSTTYFHLKGLHPDTEYTLDIRVAHAQWPNNSQLGLWSNNSTLKFKTKEDVPDANPETSLKAYEFTKSGKEVAITAYWKEIPTMKRNGRISYNISLTAKGDGKEDILISTTTTETTVTLTTKVISNAYVVYIQAMTSLGVNLNLNATKMSISGDKFTENVRFFVLNNKTITKLVWDKPSTAEQEMNHWTFTVFTCIGNDHKCEEDIDYIEVDNATTYDLIMKERTRFGLVVSSTTNHKNRMKRDMTSSDNGAVITSVRAGIQWSYCKTDLEETKVPKPMNLFLSKVQAAESMKLEWEGVPCYAKTIIIHLKDSNSNVQNITLRAHDVTNGYVIMGLPAEEHYVVYATWSWEYGQTVKSKEVRYTVTRYGLSKGQLGAVITVLIFAVGLISCGIYGMYRKLHKTVKKQVDIAVPERQQFQRLNDLDLMDREDYNSLTGNIQEPSGPTPTLFEVESANRRITLDDPICDEQRKHNVYHTGPIGIPASRQRSQSMNAGSTHVGKPKWTPPSNGRFRSNSVVETQQQMDDVIGAATWRGRQGRPSLGSSSSFTEEESGSIYFRMDSTSNSGSQVSLNSASGAVARPRAMSVSSVGSAASSFLWMSNSNEDLVDLSPTDNSCNYKITSSGPHPSNDGYLKPRGSPVLGRRQLYKNFSVIREEEEESEYVPSSRSDENPSSLLDPLDVEVAGVNYMAMSNDNYDGTYPSNSVSNMTYDYPKSYRSLTRGRLLSMTSVGSGLILEDDFEDENDLYRIASTPQRQQRSMSFDVAASASMFLRPRSASVDLLDNRGANTLLLQRIPDENEYMNPECETSGNSDSIYLNTGCTDDHLYKNDSSSAPFMEIPEVTEITEGATKIAEVYLAPTEDVKNDYSNVERDNNENDDITPSRPLLERQYSVVSENEDLGLYNGDAPSAHEHEYEIAK